jgi:GNAT superfamily N-acetyltransferase
VGLIAWRDDERIGAAWCRVLVDVLARDEAGRPFPELAIAVTPRHRSQGVGTRLLDGLAEVASDAGYTALSLTVSEHNAAHRLYERSGFDVVGRYGARLTMVKVLGPPGT